MVLGDCDELNRESMEARHKYGPTLYVDGVNQLCPPRTEDEHKPVMVTWMRTGLLICAMAISGCSSTVPREEVLGHYRANVPHADDSIELKDDGTYIHTFQDRHSRPLSRRAAGRWSLTLRGKLVCR